MRFLQRKCTKVEVAGLARIFLRSSLLAPTSQVLLYRKNVAIFHIAKAACLIALVQISSASVERVFSQMKQIQDYCGDSMLEETILVVCVSVATLTKCCRRGVDNEVIAGKERVPIRHLLSQ
jgi:hypothetical protein